MLKLWWSLVFYDTPFSLVLFDYFFSFLCVSYYYYFVIKKIVDHNYNF